MEVTLPKSERGNEEEESTKKRTSRESLSPRWSTSLIHLQTWVPLSVYTLIPKEKRSLLLFKKQNLENKENSVRHKSPTLLS